MINCAIVSCNYSTLLSHQCPAVAYIFVAHFFTRKIWLSGQVQASKWGTLTTLTCSTFDQVIFSLIYPCTYEKLKTFREHWKVLRNIRNSLKYCCHYDFLISFSMRVFPLRKFSWKFSNLTHIVRNSTCGEDTSVIFLRDAGIISWHLLFNQRDVN